MIPYKTTGHINSLKGELAEITVLEKPNENINQYIVSYRGIKCTAIYNWFVGAFYVDDIFGIISENE